MKTKPSIPEIRTIPVSCNKDCAAGCPLLAHVEDGKIVKITDNPNGTPYMKGCSKGFQAMKVADAPDRLLKPLIRTGVRGAHDYKAVSWDEALGYVAAGLRKVKGKYGSESILFLGGSGSCRGALHNTSSLNQRFLNMFGGYPADIKAIYTVGGNYLSQGSDIKKNMRAFNKVEFSVCHEHFMTPTAAYCDVILPATTFLEREDILFPGMNYLFYSGKAMEPPGNVKNDYDIFCELSDRLGFLDLYSEGVCLLQGIWPSLDGKGMDQAGAANILTSTEPTEPCMGSRTHSVLVEVELSET